MEGEICVDATLGGIVGLQKYLPEFLPSDMGLPPKTPKFFLTRPVQEADELHDTTQKWDPRFSVRAGGKFDRATFRGRYGFIDEMRESEVKVRYCAGHQPVALIHR